LWLSAASSRLLTGPLYTVYKAISIIKLA